MKGGKEKKPDPPEWLADMMLARQYGRWPWELDEAPVEWIARLYEYQYQAGKQGIGP